MFIATSNAQIVKRFIKKLTSLCNPWFCIFTVHVQGNNDILNYKDLSDLCTSQNIVRVLKSRRLRGAGHVAGMGKTTNAQRILVWKSHENRSLGRLRTRLENKIQMDSRETGCQERKLKEVTQDRVQLRILVCGVLLPVNVCICI
jgi:hypothetical protein